MAKKFPMDFSSFKKVASDKDTTTLQHPEGHTIKIMHSALSPKMRGQLAELPHMSDGGKVARTDDYQAGAKGSAGQEITKKAQEGAGKAIDATKEAVGSAVDSAKAALGFAEGGQIPGQAPTDSASSSLGQAPVTINIAQPGSQPTIPQAAINPEPGRAPASGIQMGTPAPETVDAPYGTSVPSPKAPVVAPAPPLEPIAETLPAAPPQQSEQSKLLIQTPDMQHGYEQQLKGIQQAANAQTVLGQEQEATLHQAQISQQQALDTYQKNFAELDAERKAHIVDIQNGHVAPEKYWDNHSKLLTGIGIILAGFNPTNRPNAAIEFLNHNMEQNLQAQKANLDSNHNLLSANLRQFGNMRDAEDMTRIMQADVVANHLKESAAKATSPMARAAALQTAGKLEAEYAPIMIQFAMRRSLQAGIKAGQDPSPYVQYVVPKEHQAKVFSEIQAAQNTAKMGDTITKAFEEAARENTAMKTGAGLLRTPGSVYALHQAMQPTFADLEGTVRQAAMDNTFKNITPAPGDSEHKIEQKRQALHEYLKSKASAPTAAGFGIHLDQFPSTSTDQALRLSPQQQSFVQWARQNPSNPKAQMVLKKLGVQ